jgi:hypothetical protein
MAETRLFLVTFAVHDEVRFFNAALALGRRRPAHMRLRIWLMSSDGRASYALWEAGEAAALMAIFDVEFGDSVDYTIEPVNLLYG